MKHLEVIFSGTVQGVGFRYTTHAIARKYQVTGYVRNLTNGNVEVIAEGEEAELQDFLKAITESSLSSYIRHKDVRWSAFHGAFRTFEIKY